MVHSNRLSDGSCSDCWEELPSSIGVQGWSVLCYMNGQIKWRYKLTPILMGKAQQVFMALPTFDVTDYTNSGEGSSPATMGIRRHTVRGSVLCERMNFM